MRLLISGVNKSWRQSQHGGTRPSLGRLFFDAAASAAHSYLHSVLGLPVSIFCAFFFTVINCLKSSGTFCYGRGNLISAKHPSRDSIKMSGHNAASNVPDAVKHLFKKHQKQEGVTSLNGNLQSNANEEGWVTSIALETDKQAQSYIEGLQSFLHGLDVDGQVGREEVS
jgi:hypothetical protein